MKYFSVMIAGSLMIASLRNNAMENNRVWVEEKPKVVELIVHVKRSTDVLDALGQISENSDYSTFILVEAERAAAYEYESKNHCYGQINCPDILDNCG